MTRARLYAVMIACFGLGAVTAVTAQYLDPVLVAAVSAVAGFWIMYGMIKVAKL